MNQRFLFALAGAVLCGLLAIVLFQRIIKNKIESDQSNERSNALVAKTRIPAGTIISPEHLQLSPVFNTSKPSDALADPKVLLGKKAIIDIEQSHFVTLQNTSDQGFRLVDNMRAITIRIDEASGINGFAGPGSFVDVISVMTPQGVNTPIATTVAQRLKILAYGNDTQVRADGKPKPAATVTLEATLAQAQALTLASREGTLQLVLRNPQYAEIEKPIAVVIGDMVERKIPEANPMSRPVTTSANYGNLPPSFQTPTPTPRVAPSPALPPTPPSVKMIAIRGFEGSAKEKTVLVQE